MLTGFSDKAFQHLSLPYYKNGDKNEDEVIDLKTLKRTHYYIIFSIVQHLEKYSSILGEDYVKY